MPKPFANPQTYQEDTIECIRRKENQFQDGRANILKPHSPLESCPNPCSSPEEEPRACERAGGWLGGGQANSRRERPPGTPWCHMQPPQEVERKPLGSKFRDPFRDPSAHLQQEHTAGCPSATAATAAHRRFSLDTTRRPGNHQHGDSCPRKPKSNTNQRTPGETNRRSCQCHC